MLEIVGMIVGLVMIVWGVAGDAHERGFEAGRKSCPCGGGIVRYDLRKP